MSFGGEGNYGGSFSAGPAAGSYRGSEGGYLGSQRFSSSSAAGGADPYAVPKAGNSTRSQASASVDQLKNKAKEKLQNVDWNEAKGKAIKYLKSSPYERIVSWFCFVQLFLGLLGTFAREDFTPVIALFGLKGALGRDRLWSLFFLAFTIESLVVDITWMSLYGGYLEASGNSLPDWTKARWHWTFTMTIFLFATKFASLYFVFMMQRKLPTNWKVAEKKKKGADVEAGGEYNFASAAGLPSGPKANTETLSALGYSSSTGGASQYGSYNAGSRLSTQ